MVFGQGVRGRKRAETQSLFPSEDHPGDGKYVEDIRSLILELEGEGKFFSTYVLPQDDRYHDQDQLVERILGVMNNMVSTVVHTHIEALNNKVIALTIVHAFYRSEQLYDQWKIDDYPIFGGLLAAFVLNKIQKVLDRMHEQQQRAKYKDCYDEVVNRVVKLLNDCYIDKEDTAIEAIKIDYHPYIESHAQFRSQMTLLDLAFKADCDSFLGHNCCKKLITERWTKGFRAKGPTFFFSIFFIPMFFLVDFNKQDKVISNDFRMNTNTNPQQPDIWEKIRKWKKTAITHIKLFYSSTCFKFYLHTIFHLMYIMLFAYILMEDTNVPTNEMLSRENWWAKVRIMCLTVWQLSYHSEVVYHRLIGKTHFVNEAHSTASVLGFVLYLLSYLEEFDAACTAFRSAAFFSFYVSFILTTLRTMRILSTNVFYGIVILMIRKMAETLTSFILIFGIFWFAFAVTMISLTGDSKHSIFWRLFIHGAFEIFGEVQDVHRNGQLDECDPTFHLLSNATDCSISCTLRSTMIPIVVFLYMFIVTILIVNLVIAFFTNTYDTIRSTSQLHYRYKKYERLVEYETITWWPHPLALIYYMLKLFEKTFSTCFSFCCIQQGANDTGGNNEETGQSHETSLDSPVPIEQGGQPADISAATASKDTSTFVPEKKPPRGQSEMAGRQAGNRSKTAEKTGQTELEMNLLTTEGELSEDENILDEDQPIEREKEEDEKRKKIIDYVKEKRNQIVENEQRAAEEARASATFHSEVTRMMAELPRDIEYAVRSEWQEHRRSWREEEILRLREEVEVLRMSMRLKEEMRRGAEKESEGGSARIKEGERVLSK